jgi:cyclomaltodextrinase / maltogenic alpha-amylase / neopullulanase
MNDHWATDAIFYHLFPLGVCGAPQHNDLSIAPQARLDALVPWLDHARDLGATAVLLGPVMESGSHGYDVADYFQVDRRLGERATLAWVAGQVHERGMRLVLDGVFHHVGRLFWAFRDVLERGASSRFADWFYLDFAGKSPYNDPFSYMGWNGCNDLVKLNLANPEVRDHLFEAVADWVREYHIDGLRLDAADHLDMGFMRDLGECCRRLKSDFWLMGEVVKGPYRAWLEDAHLDSVTNYECYKGLFSSLKDANYYEIAYSLRRHFGNYGLYRDASLLTFADNHDVSRVASLLSNPSLLFPLYCMLFTIPGVPSIYYGSEFGIEGVKTLVDDWPLRPTLDLTGLAADSAHSDLERAIARLARLRTDLPALRRGDFQELFLSHRRIVFSRRTPDQWVIVAISAEKEPVEQEVTLPESIDGQLVDMLNPGEHFEVAGGKTRLVPLWPLWARVMEVQRK